MIYCSTFVNAAAFRDHFLQLRLDTPESEQRATVMRIFGPSFFTLYDCKRFDRQIDAFNLRRLGEIGIVEGNVKFFPDWDGLKPNNWALSKSLEGLLGYAGCFNSDTVLADYFIKILIVPRHTEEDLLKIMNTHFARNTFVIKPLDQVGNRRCLTTIVDNARHRYFIREGE